VRSSFPSLSLSPSLLLRHAYTPLFICLDRPSLQLSQREFIPRITLPKKKRVY
jgi:hypothetical protein